MTSVEADPTRLDAALVARGLARSRARAHELIEEGLVTLNGRPAAKASIRVRVTDDIAVSGATHDWVGRGALKLVHALQVFGPRLSPAGRVCLDVGASTGGFTQVLLRAGAQHVVALDVGHGQLVEQLRTDSRVTERSGLNIRHTEPADLAGPHCPDGMFELVVADLSFISLTLTFQPMTSLLRPEGDLVVLVKPQFEVGRERLGKDGIVTSATERHRALARVIAHAEACGLHVWGRANSPITGTEGNEEFLLWLRREAPPELSVRDEMLGRTRTASPAGSREDQGEA